MTRKKLSNRLFGMMVVLSKWQLLNWIDDITYLKLMYRLSTGRKLNIDNPTMFGEKIQWLKIYDYHPIYTKMVDKFEAKKYVENLIGHQYIIPTIGVWDRFDDIDFCALPNSFVLKCTHDSGGLVICKDKHDLNIENARKVINKCLKSNYYSIGREIPYRDVPHRVIAESFLKSSVHSELIDYKFYCFDGVPTYCQVITDRSTDERIDFYNMEWEHMNFQGLNFQGFGTPVKPFSDHLLPMPECFEEMKRIASILSKNIPFIRVDLYNIDGKPYFGELTFYPASGFGIFEPQNFNQTIGAMIALPDKQL